MIRNVVNLAGAQKVDVTAKIADNSTQNAENGLWTKSKRMILFIEGIVVWNDQNLQNGTEL